MRGHHPPARVIQLDPRPRPDAHLTLPEGSRRLVHPTRISPTGVPVTDPSIAPGGWAFRPVPPEARSVVAWIADGVLDARLAATLWQLIEARVPLVVTASDPGVDAEAFLGGLLQFVPPDVRLVPLRGSDETFDWLPQATDLGWPGTPGEGDGDPVRPDTTTLVARELSDRLPVCTWADAARIAVRATAIGYGLATTMRAASLDAVFDSLGRAPVSLTPDEQSYLGCVLVVERVDGARQRVVAAHYVRPFVRDTHGHTQRLGPAVLATWDRIRDAFEDFSWGITPELAFRIGVKAGDFEGEVDRRTTVLDGLVGAGVIGLADVQAAIAMDRTLRPVG